MYLYIIEISFSSNKGLFWIKLVLMLWISPEKVLWPALDFHLLFQTGHSRDTFPLPESEWETSMAGSNWPKHTQTHTGKYLCTHTHTQHSALTGIWFTMNLATYKSLFIPLFSVYVNIFGKFTYSTFRHSPLYCFTFHFIFELYWHII